MTSLADLKKYLNISDTSQDELLGKIILTATENINNLCRRSIYYNRFYDIVSGNGETIFRLNNYPVEKIEEIKYRTDTGGYTNDLFTSGTINDNLILIQETGKVILLNNYKLPYGESNLRIKYFAGYMIDAVDPINETPEDLKGIGLMMSAELFLKSHQSITADSSKDYDFLKRIGLNTFETYRSDGTSVNRRKYTYINEDYGQLLAKYRKRRV